MLRKAGFLVALVFVLLAGCSGNKEETIIDKPQTDKEEVAAKPVNTYPLTGVGTDEEVNHRAVSVMVNNHPKARPQSGLSKADVVYEVLAESNITRFLAIYQSEFPENIGPIRSARDYYIELAKGYESLYIFHGWSPDAKKLIQSDYIDHLNGLNHDGTLFKRSSDRKAPHNSYITYENILEGAQKEGYSMEENTPPYSFFSDDETGLISGEDYKVAALSYGSADYDVTYKYDSASEKYTRHTAGVRTEDQDTKDPVLLDNILIVEAIHKVIDDKGRRSIDLTAGGDAYLLQKGKRLEIQWVSKDGRIVPVSGETEVKLVQGKTWINIIPDQPGLNNSVKLSND